MYVDYMRKPGKNYSRLKVDKVAEDNFLDSKFYSTVTRMSTFTVLYLRG